MNCTNWFGRRFACFIFLILFLPTVAVYASEAELTNLVIKNSQDDLLIDLTVKGVFTNEMQTALLNGIPVSFTFLINLYEVHDFWFDKKIAGVTTIHKIQYEVLKKEFRIRRSWEKTGLLVTKNYEKACLLMAQIEGLSVIPLTKLKKGKHYQLTVKSELKDKKYLFAGFPWEFETDWYTINFVY
jgi:hypothetical protein